MRRRSLSVVLAFLPLFIVGSATATVVPDGQSTSQLPGEIVIEPASKVEFPVRLPVPGGSARHTLTGTGIRTAWWFLKVYAYGLYIDEEAAQEFLQEWSGKPARELQEDDALYDVLLGDNFGKSLRLVLTRDVGGDDIAEAFYDALEPRIDRVTEEVGMAGGAEALAQFRNYFGGYFNAEKVVKGTELIFVSLRGGTLVTAVNGEVTGRIDSRALCWALFDVYLGDDPISQDGKMTLVARVPELLARGHETGGWPLTASLAPDVIVR